MKLLSILCLVSIASVANAFSVISRCPVSKIRTNDQFSSSSKSSSILFSKTDDDYGFGSDIPQISTTPTDTTESKSAAKITEAEDTGDYPLNVPSPVLLASSMVIAIAVTGSIFELSGGNPVLGVIPSVGVALVGLPSCFFLFYAAIKKGIAETEEDDREFQRGRSNNRF